MSDETPAPTPSDDVAAARAQAVQLVTSGSRIAWAGPVISTLILVSFTGVLLLVLLRGVPADSQAVLLLLGTLAAMATQVANYWLGSSAGSAAKARHIEALDAADRAAKP